MARTACDGEANRAVYSNATVVDGYSRSAALLPPERYLFGKYIHPGMAILDIGVGGGRTSAALAKGASRYVGIDYSEAMIEASRRRYPQLTFLCQDATDLSIFPDASFNAAIFSFNGIDYIPTDAGRISVLAEMRRVITSDGIAIISSHNARHLIVYPDLRGVGPARAVWRLARSAARTLSVARRHIGSGVFRAGSGYFHDPVHGGLLSHASTPGSIAADAAKAGLRITERVGAHFPRRVPNMMNSWETYVLVRV